MPSPFMQQAGAGLLPAPSSSITIEAKPGRLNAKRYAGLTVIIICASLAVGSLMGYEGVFPRHIVDSVDSTAKANALAGAGLVPQFLTAGLMLGRALYNYYTRGRHSGTIGSSAADVSWNSAKTYAKVFALHVGLGVTCGVIGYYFSRGQDENMGQNNHAQQSFVWGLVSTFVGHALQASFMGAVAVRKYSNPHVRNPALGVRALHRVSVSHATHAREMLAPTEEPDF